MKFQVIFRQKRPVNRSMYACVAWILQYSRVLVVNACHEPSSIDFCEAVGLYVLLLLSAKRNKRERFDRK